MIAKRKQTYLSDYWTTEDALNFGVFKPALMDILQNAETPLALGVFGTWGSGKTSLLRMLEAEIKSEALPACQAVWFTAWKYDKQDALWRAFILRVIDELYPQENGKRIPKEKLTDKDQIEAVEHLDHLAESLYQTVSWQGEESWSLDVQQTTKEVIKLPIWLALHLAKLGDAAKDLGLQPQLAELIGREAQTHYMQQLASMEQFERSFETAISKVLGPEGRLVIFVDDLDRCLPEKAVEILEAIKLFLNVPQTIFVLGMDREIVRRGIESHYGIFLRAEGEERPELPINGDVYLQKLIQLPFNLPPLDVDGRQKFIEQLETQMAAEASLDTMTCQVFARGLLPNPRQVKRALNVYNLLRKIAEAQEAQALIPPKAIAWPLLAKTVLIQSQWPELYALWRQYPTLIQTLEEAYRQQPLTEREIILGQLAEGREPRAEGAAPEASGSEGAEPPPAHPAQPARGGLLEPFITDRRKYALLMALLNFPPEVGAGRQRARFEGLPRPQLQAYLGLAGTAEPEAEPTEDTALPTDLLSELQSGDPAILREALTRISEQEPEPDGPLHQRTQNILRSAAQNPALSPPERANTAAELDKLGYLPADLYSFVEISPPPAAFRMGRYPVTNAQYQRFLEAEDFAKEAYWRNFPKYAEPQKEYAQIGDWGDEGWQWLQTNLDENQKLYPREWHKPDFGIVRAGVPVVGITWYEANAYCKWLLAHWDELAEAEQNPGWKPDALRLPTEAEWMAAAGGADPADRYPWDKAGEVTQEKAEILQRANVEESNIGRTTPVGMYPLGVSPTGVWDLGGNVWEWQANYYNDKHQTLALRGGAWYDGSNLARLSVRGHSQPYPRWSNLGFRLVAPPSE